MSSRKINLSRLTIRDDVQSVTFHREPTPAECKFGYGAIHYRDL